MVRLKGRQAVSSTIPTDGGAQAVAPWFAARDALRGRLSHRQASAVGDAFVRLVPHRLQRACERKFDFPVAEIVRSAPLLLIRVPKTASASLALQIYGQVSHVPHRTAAFYRDADPMFFAGTTSFAVVRDPWQRAASAYRWLRGSGSALAAPDRRGRALAAQFDSFERFVLDMLLPAAEAGRLRRLDPVLHPQWPYVCDPAGAIIVDRVFRLERMDEVQAFLVASGVSAGEVRGNASGGDGAGEASRDVVAALGRIYAQDALLFGYRVPIAPP